MISYIRPRHIMTGIALAALLGCTVTDICAQDTYWQQRVTLFDRLPVGENDIVFLGNSITDGGEFSELFGIENCLNRGIRSDIINGVVKRLDQVTKGHPKKIFLLIGINDVSHGHSAEKIAGMYEALVAKIRKDSPETTLYVQSIMPINNDFRRYKNLIGRENVIPQLNGYLEDIATRHGAVYVDLWPALADTSGTKLDKRFTNDGLHLTGAGYQAWASVIGPLVRDEETPQPDPDPTLDTTLPLIKIGH